MTVVKTEQQTIVLTMSFEEAVHLYEMCGDFDFEYNLDTPQEFVDELKAQLIATDKTITTTIIKEYQA